VVECQLDRKYREKEPIWLSKYYLLITIAFFFEPKALSSFSISKLQWGGFKDTNHTTSRHLAHHSLLIPAHREEPAVGVLWTGKNEKKHRFIF